MDGKQFDNIESVLTYLGGYGRIQKFLTIIIASLQVPSAITAMIMFFVAANPDWICRADSTKCNLTGIQKSSNNFRCHANISRTDWEFIVPKDYSIITEYNLVCEREWLGYISTSIFYIGWPIGAANCGSFANRFGRKLTIFISWFFLISIGIVISFSPNIYFFIACQFLIGLTMPGISEIAFVYLGEMVDNKNRPFAHMILVCAYTVSMCLLSLKAYFIRKWRYLRIACSAPYLVMLFSYKFVPSSVHWLHLRGYNTELKNVFGRIAKTNKTMLPSAIAIKSTVSTDEKKKTLNFITLLIHSNMRKTILLLMFTFFTAVAVYYGFFMTADEFDISMYISFALFSVVEIPSNIIGSVVSARFGRKIAIPGSLLMGSFGSFIVAGLKFTDLKILRTIAGMLVQGCLIVSFNYLISWAVEILPTNIRAVGLGVVCSIGRLGGITVPWISKGLLAINPIAPFIAIGVLGTISGGLMFLLPETKGVPMDDKSTDTNVFHKYVLLIYDEHSPNVSQIGIVNNTLQISTLQNEGNESLEM